MTKKSDTIPGCLCSFAQRMNGDGCYICNPELNNELQKEQEEEENKINKILLSKYKENIKIMIPYNTDNLFSLCVNKTPLRNKETRKIGVVMGLNTEKQSIFILNEWIGAQVLFSSWEHLDGKVCGMYTWVAEKGR